MPFRFFDFLAELEGQPQPKIEFDPPRRAQLDRELGAAKLGCFTTVGARMRTQEPFEPTNDLSYRVLPRALPSGDLVFDHETPIRVWALEDLNVAYPRDRLVELEEEGFIGTLAEDAVSMLGSISRHTELVRDVVPQLVAEFRRQDVDAVLVVPFCPACHRTAALVARALDTRGLPTLSMSTLLESAQAFKPPRVAFADFPLGCPVGRPRDPEHQRAVLRAVLESASRMRPDDAWRIAELDLAELGLEWAPDGDRAWEEVVKRLYREGRAVLAAHGADHRARGEPLAGKEREFSVRCDC